MKKWIALLIALMMTVSGAAALAVEEPESAVNQEAMKLFSSEWADGFASVKIYAEEDHWRVMVSGTGSAEWDYFCQYDEAEKKLVSRDEEENIKTEITVDDMGSEIARNDVYLDGKAEFYLNEDGKLIWKDELEDAGKDLVFEKIGWFQSVWVAGDDMESRYEMNIYWDVEVAGDDQFSGYKVEIEHYEGEVYTHWAYACAYDPETNTLSGILGSKETAKKEGDPIEMVYDDGEAEFSIDDEGCVRWNDKKENAGEGLQFNATNG